MTEPLRAIDIPGFWSDGLDPGRIWVLARAAPPGKQKRTLEIIASFAQLAATDSAAVFEDGATAKDIATQHAPRIRKLLDLAQREGWLP